MSHQEMPLQVSFVHSIHQVDPVQWDALWPDDYPFTRHAFLAALEDSGSTSAESGWQPNHALLRWRGTLVGVMPLYVKTHSYGEYVFDWAWASAYAEHGLAYYPKLINAIPFTPATGPRVALADQLTAAEAATAVQSLQEHLVEHIRSRGYSGWHSLFPDADSQARLAALPLVTRYGYQFHWFNQGYGSFEDFTGTFSSRKRKNLKKERLRVTDSGLELRRRRGGEVGADEWRFFHALYQHTYLKRSGAYGYLGGSFFERLAQAMPEQVLLVSAHAKGSTRMVAAAFYLQDSRRLYGRYWGSVEEFDGLHFEACYYQGIDYAIEQGLERFDPGAQGEHKIQRGFTPVLTCSRHWLADDRFQPAISRFCEQEALHLQEYMEAARASLPFREGVEPPPQTALLSQTHLR